MVVVSFVLKKTVVGRRFEAIGANPLAARAVGLRVQLHQLMAYVCAQLLYCMAGILIAGITREPTAFQGDTLLLPSVAVVVLGGTSLLGGRGYPISTVVAAFFLNQLSQFALAVGVPYSAQTIIQALALGFGIGVYSIRWTVAAIRKLNNKEEKMKYSIRRNCRSPRQRDHGPWVLDPGQGRSAVLVRPQEGITGLAGWLWRQQLASGDDSLRQAEALKCPSITKYEYADGQGDTQKSISDIKGMAAKGIDALVVFGDAGPAVLPAITSVFKSGKVIVPYRVNVGGEEGKNYTKFIGSRFVMTA